MTITEYVNYDIQTYQYYYYIEYNQDDDISVISNPYFDTENEGNENNNHEENISNNNNKWTKVKPNNNNDDHVGSNKYDHSTKHNFEYSSEYVHTTNRYGVLWTKDDDNISANSNSITKCDDKYYELQE